MRSDQVWPVVSDTPAEVRRQWILDYVGARDYVRVAELGDQFGVSHVTIRADLAAMERRGLIARVRGGAMPTRRLVSERSFEETAGQNAQEKAAIGRAAAALVQDGESIAIDVGTTTAALAHALVRRGTLQQVTVFTNSLRIASELEPAIPRITVVVTGGTLRPMQHSLVDPMASGIFDRIRPHIVFLGANGLDAVHGVTNVNVPEAEMKLRMARVARRVVLLVDGSKLGRVDVVQVCTADELDLVVTGASAPASELEALREAGVEILVAPVTGGEGTQTGRVAASRLRVLEENP
jgi:DeoR family transcriptional regulator, aga operon transcriptional repressor